MKALKRGQFGVLASAGKQAQAQTLPSRAALTALAGRPGKLKPGAATINDFADASPVNNARARLSPTNRG